MATTPDAAAAPARGPAEGGAAPAGTVYPKPAYAWYVTGLLLVTSVIAYVDRLILGFLIDPIKADLQLSDTEAGLLLGVAFALFYVTMGIPIGRLIDTRSKKGVLAVCMAFWSAMTTLCGFATSFVMLFLARCGVGAGEAAMNPAAVSIIGDHFPKEKVARPISVYTLSIHAGGGLAVILGGVLIQWFASLGPVSILGFENIETWRLVFVVIGLPGLVVALLVWMTIRDRPAGGGAPGAPRQAVPWSEVFAYLRGHAKLYGLLFGGLVSFGFYIYAVQGWYPAMLVRTYGVSPLQISTTYGVIFFTFGILGALAVDPLLRFLNARGHADAPALACLLAALAMTVPAAIAPLMPTFALSLAVWSVAMFGWALTTSVSFAAIVLVTPPGMRGLMIAAYMVLMNVTGGAFGTVLVGALSDHVYGPEHLNYAIATQAAIFMPLAALLFAALRRPYRRAIREQEAAA